MGDFERIAVGAVGRWTGAGARVSGCWDDSRSIALRTGPTRRSPTRRSGAAGSCARHWQAAPVREESSRAVVREPSPVAGLVLAAAFEGAGVIAGASQQQPRTVGAGRQPPAGLTRAEQPAVIPASAAFPLSANTAA